MGLGQGRFGETLEQTPHAQGDFLLQSAPELCVFSSWLVGFAAAVL
ncbi:hypothetical protein RSSM_02441 [Rhodopirellula sallentina SM41]|uniref:Uncharacterized protein n=1 Tax=Rhodopirellula sallentina SM41 TaxID=1263870 RepID=M5UE21_9BACT|nr:hypothetical protein RSSM_02441 [Rhodopirellula sallentina SM41]